MEASATKKKPRVSFVLALLGGVLIVDSGLVGGVYTALETTFTPGLLSVLNVTGFVWGILIAVCACLLRFKPERHRILGVIIIFSSVLGFFVSIVGAVLALAGGILAIVWRSRD